MAGLDPAGVLADAIAERDLAGARDIAAVSDTPAIVATVPSFLALGPIVANTDLLAIVPRILASTSAAKEKLRILELPIELPPYSVKQYWHERFHADPANTWLRNTLMSLFSNLGESARL